MPEAGCQEGRTGGLEKGSDKWGGQQDWGCNPDFSIPSTVPLLPRPQVRVHFPKLPNHSFPSALLLPFLPDPSLTLTGLLQAFSCPSLSSSALQSFLRRRLFSTAMKGSIPLTLQGKSETLTPVCQHTSSHKQQFTTTFLCQYTARPLQSHARSYATAS